jgi:CRISPR system Cascade subunit CasE
MYLSCLLIDVGANPDRPRPARRLWLRNSYRVHQRLCMAFPSLTRAAADPDFLTPFVPDDFADVKGERSESRGFLFRVDPLPGNRAMILVQSARKPDWDYAFCNAQHFLAGPPQTHPFDPRFEAGQRLRFRLLANPVRKARLKDRDGKALTQHMSKGSNGLPLGDHWHGRDVPVPDAELDKWLLRRAEPESRSTKNSTGEHPPGFKIESINVVRPGYVNVSKSRADAGDDARRRRSALYEGILEVTDTDHFRATIISGIGPGKAFGFGLLSVAPI